MIRILLAIIILLNLNTAIAAKNNIKSAIQQQLKNIVPPVNIGIKIRDLTTNKVIYQQNEQKYYNFASSLKFITLATLREHFGDNHIFSSKIFKKVNNYYLDIYDADFSTDNLEFLIKSIKDQGVNNIDDFFIVNSQFSLPPLMEGKMLEDSVYCYGALITKVHINKNCARIQVNPAEKTKDKIYFKHIGVSPYKVINHATTIAAKSRDKIHVSIKKDALIIKGTLNKDHKNLVISAVSNDNLMHIKLVLQKLLTKYNISLKGNVIFGPLPQNAKEIVVINKSFHQLASIALKKSDNYITDYLFSVFSDLYGSIYWQDAGKLIKQLAFEKLNVDFNDAVIVDGSGLSRYNLLSVNQFDQFLNNIYNKKDYKIILSMLAQSAEESTLKGRFLGVNIFAKTGSMTGVSSLAGYFFDKNNNPYSFVIVSNNFIGSKKKYMDLEEEIVRIVLELSVTKSNIAVMPFKAKN